MNRLFTLLILLLFAGRIAAQFEFPVEEMPAKCGVVCMNQDSIQLDSSIERNNFFEQYSLILRFHLLNGNVADYKKSIREGMKMINEEFEGAIHFVMDDTICEIDSDTKLTELYADFATGGNLLDSLTKENAKKGVINIFLIETVPDQATGTTLLGFTPVYVNQFEGYSIESPRMDNIFVSYRGLMKNTTLIHEMGHFLSLAHPWQLNSVQRKNLGLEDEKEVCVNHMNYNCFIDRFTTGQIHQMQHFAITFREYLFFKN